MQVECLKGRATDVSSFRPSFFGGRGAGAVEEEHAAMALTWAAALPCQPACLPCPYGCPRLLTPVAVAVGVAVDVLASPCSTAQLGLPISPFAGTQPNAKFLPEQ